MSTRTSGPNSAASRGQLPALLNYTLGKALHADRQLVAAFPKLARAAKDSHLRKLCREGVDYTEERIERLNRVFDLLGSEPRVRASPAMKGLIRDALLASASDGFEDTARDAVILDAVMKISHFGRAAYWMACAYAEALDERKVKSILMQSLKEKEEAIAEMMGMAEGDIIPRIRREDRSQAVRTAVPRARRAGGRNGRGAARPQRAAQRRSA
jgi:ferritin-like metal-binding protein YciE